MSTDPSPSKPLQVVIAGGGVAALEASLALRALAGEAVSVKLIASKPEFVNRPMTVREPFSYAQAQRYSLAEIAGDIGAELVADAVASVDTEARIVHTAGGAEHRYDALLVALGARIRARYEHATTIDDRNLDELLHGLIQDVEGGYVNRLAFVVPPHMAWPFPIYELALMTATRAYDSNVEVSITIQTPEDAPLAIFGDGASKAVADLLAGSRIEVITSAYCEIPQPGVIDVSPGDRRLQVDRVIALPELAGPSLPGLTEGENGFIAVDVHCRVRGLEREYAAGDATDFAVKHGGIAAQQADTAAEAIAALAGAPVEPEPFHPIIRGMLLTGGKPLYLSAHITGGHGFQSEASEHPSWAPAGKIAAKYLGPYLEERARASGRAGSG
jgi:sulfide:quinone oxidoreductase